MAGFDLKEGFYDSRKLSEDELWSVFSNIFSSRSRNDSSYKYGFFKAILDNLYNVDEDLKLSFDILFGKFTEIYWNLILKYNIRQKTLTKDNRETYLEQILHKIAEENEVAEGIPFESLDNEVMISMCQKVKNKCKIYVIGALYADANQIFYSFIKKDEWIQINPIVYSFLSRHKSVIEKLNYYEWAKFLEKVNDNETTINLLNKLDCSALRTDLSVYRQILFREFENEKCFYCEKRLNSNNSIEMDHFIPWSFIKDDNLWNLVVSCQDCNRKKSDRLPDIHFLDYLIERNEKIIINNECNKQMSNYKSVKLRYVYSWAKSNGYNKIWNPKNNGNIEE